MKRIVALIMAIMMVCALVSATAEAYTTDFDVPATGEKFVIYAWNDEFKGMLQNYYIPAVGGTVAEDGTMTLPNGDQIEFVVNPNDNGVYQQKLDAALGAGEHIDMFLIEADYALKYVDSDYTLPLEEIGITEDQLAKQYPYTVTVATDSNGQIKGSSWQAAPGLFLYRRSLAEKYLGVTTPEEMQEKVKDWDAFLATAREVNEKSAGATKLIPSNGDVWQVVRTVRSTPWVDEAYNLVIDDQVKWYFDFAKTLRDENLTAMATPWTEAWNAGVGNDSIMGYFFSTWGIQWTMVGNSGGSKPGEGTYGDWAAVNGPQPYYWGGTWICAAAGTDNAETIKDVMAKLTCDKDIALAITTDTQDYTNNVEAMNELASSDYASAFLGGQNHIALFAKAAPNIDMSNAGPYDQGCNEGIQTAFKDYFDGVVDIDTAKKNFETIIMEKYPELTEVVWP